MRAGRLAAKIAITSTLLAGVATAGSGMAFAFGPGGWGGGQPTPLSSAFGTVLAVNGSTSPPCGSPNTSGAFTITAWQSTSTVTIDVSTTTDFFEPMVTPPVTFGNVCVGDLVGALGTESSGVIAATKVFIAPPQTTPPPLPTPPSSVFGTVATVNGSTSPPCGSPNTSGTFTITAWQSTSTVTVNVSTTTDFVEPRATPPVTFGNVCVGDLVGALGTESSGGIDATKVFVAPPPAPPPGNVFGTVQTVNGSTSPPCGSSDTSGDFTVTTWQSTSTVTVDVSTTTNYYEPGATPPFTFSNVCVGDLVGALGTESSGGIDATKVFVAPPPSSSSTSSSSIRILRRL
jgi:hypothetical protein